jgi:hypothetical protein
MIFLEIRGMNGICATESSKKDFIRRVKLQLQGSGANHPKDIFFDFSGRDVKDIEGDASNFCIVHAGPKVSTEDLNLLVKILKHESCLGDHILISNLEPIPKKIITP